MKEIYDILYALGKFLGSDVLISVEARYDCLIFRFRWFEEKERKEYAYAVPALDTERLVIPNASAFVDFMKHGLRELKIKPDKIYS